MADEVGSGPVYAPLSLYVEEGEKERYILAHLKEERERREEAEREREEAERERDEAIRERDEAIRRLEETKREIEETVRQAEEAKRECEEFRRIDEELKKANQGCNKKSRRGTTGRGEKGKERGVLLKRNKELKSEVAAKRARTEDVTS